MHQLQRQSLCSPHCDKDRPNVIGSFAGDLSPRPSRTAGGKSPACGPRPGRFRANPSRRSFQEPLDPLPDVLLSQVNQPGDVDQRGGHQPLRGWRDIADPGPTRSLCGAKLLSQLSSFLRSQQDSQVTSYGPLIGASVRVKSSGVRSISWPKVQFQGIPVPYLL